jgi:signal transduction histidine kinase
VVDLVGALAAKKGLELAYGVAPNTPETAVGDVSRLRQILLNLLNNAVKFTEAGEIVVGVATDPTDRPDVIAYHLTVRDTGIGIPPGRVDRLFESFSQVDATTSRRYGGTGLGLAISKRLAELMGGTIWVESDGVPGEGSTFHVAIECGVTDMTPTALRHDGSFDDRRAGGRRQRDEPAVVGGAARRLGHAEHARHGCRRRAGCLDDGRPMSRSSTC